MKNIFNETEFSAIKVDGKDASDFLHRITSQDIKGLQNGSVRGAALLTSNANIISWFQVYRKNQAYFLIMDQDFEKPTLDELEKMHFAEELKIEKLKFDSFFISGPDANNFLEKSFGKTLSEDMDFLEVISNNEPHWIFKFRNGYLLSFRLEDFKESLASEGFNQLKNPEESRLDRNEPKFGKDLGTKNLILEGPFEEYVSRTKGCYPGQEIVERVFTYGNVTKKLMSFQIPKGCQLKFGDSLILEENPIGTVTSFSGTKAFIMVKKPWFKAGTKATLSGQNITLESIPGTFEIQR